MGELKELKTYSTSKSRLFELFYFASIFKLVRKANSEPWILFFVNDSLFLDLIFSPITCCY
jgi:hypothetical protein